MEDHLIDDDLTILDVQPNVHDYIQEHIPGAISVPWKLFVDDGNARLLKPDDEIEVILDAHDIVPERMIIRSCGTVHEATNKFILFKWFLGVPKVEIYE